MKSISMKAVFFGTLLFCSNVFASDVSMEDPYVMIKEVSQITFDRFAREEQQIKANPNLLKGIVREELMPYVFYQYAALKVLGNYRKDASREEIQEFVVAFREYLITSYAQVFTLYDNQKIEFEPAKDFDKEKIVMVGVDVIDGNRPPINLKFKVRKNTKTNEWQAFDLVAEGVSLLDAKQKELRSILAQNGVPQVTEMLREKSKRDIVFKKNGKDDVMKEIGIDK
ncbi:ABC transporter substrate-binding protein [Thalassotalea litorea]|uniref:ABC transporter substrate-binding protein n=1 Tax=Thalassotalea litorea TaxID=2020715 RepID=UPI003736EA95